MNPAVDAGVLGLLRLGRLSATSLLVDGPSAARNLPALLGTGAQVGLHLNLTESFGQPGLCLPLRALIQAAYLRRLPPQAVRDAVDRQLRRFQALTGRLPDYVDGHQHVHQLPLVRDALLEALAALPGPRPWLRDTGRPRTAGLPWALRLKARVIAGLGAGGLRRRARAVGLRQNPGFLGVYDFKGGAQAYQAWMSLWLAQCQDGDELMCHPALGPDAADALSAQRQAEYAVLASARMADWLAEYHLTIEGAAPLQGTDMNSPYRALTADLSVSPQLQPADMRAVADAGFKSLIINRPDGEGGAEQPLSADVLEAARAAGLQARYQPVVSGAITAADVAEFGRLLHELPGPVLAFCRSGGRCTQLFQLAQEAERNQAQG
ncbi:Chitooligosaccharide deacetylase [Castellaniella caeni]